MINYSSSPHDDKVQMTEISWTKLLYALQQTFNFQRKCSLVASYNMKWCLVAAWMQSQGNQRRLEVKEESIW